MLIWHQPWSKFSFLLDEASSPSMSTRSLLTSESFNALSVTSAGVGAEASGASQNCDWTKVPLYGIATCCLLFFDGRGHRGIALHARGYYDLRSRYSDHGRGSGSRRGCHGNCSLLNRLLGGFGGNGHSAVLIQLPFDGAFNLSPADTQHSGDDTLWATLEKEKIQRNVIHTAKKMKLWLTIIKTAKRVSIHSTFSVHRAKTPRKSPGVWTHTVRSLITVLILFRSSPKRRTARRNISISVSVHLALWKKARWAQHKQTDGYDCTVTVYTIV